MVKTGKEIRISNKMEMVMIRRIKEGRKIRRRKKKKKIRKERRKNKIRIRNINMIRAEIEMKREGRVKVEKEIVKIKRVKMRRRKRKIRIMNNQI